MKKMIIFALSCTFALLGFLVIADNGAAASSKTMYVTADSLNVRQAPSIKAKIETKVKKHTALIVQEVDGSWSKVTVNQQTGWVSSKYLTLKKPQNYANRLKTIDKNSQLILVTSNGGKSSKADIMTYDRNKKGKWVLRMKVKGHIGKYGFTTNKTEGNSETPVGKYTIGTAFGQKGNPGTKLPFRNITNDDVWVDDPSSKLYNTWQSREKTEHMWKSAENMNHKLYKYGFVINYNTKRIPNKGSAIFFHIGNSYTLGCTATSETNVIRILKWLDPKKEPVIIQTPLNALNKY
ncbi:SH3 domain-containing protein [Aciduricibacillus chroicocephali]|uniref:SH3 domain-containing protein n=1 Tax=Aciduricibacillus chroicocephali TaxID=3054939 RepID=A0ABY9KW53_9BACI|nr:SH3 domain-containing protein [Bacillaceae bacterium 44XB]